MLIESNALVGGNTKLLFRTPPGAQVISTGTTNLTRNLPKGSIFVAPFGTIRVLFVSRPDSEAPVTLKLTMQQGNELVMSLDTITIEPGDGVTKVYPIPGNRLRLSATITESDAKSFVDVLVYGRR